jgi:hypothetical protein
MLSQREHKYLDEIEIKLEKPKNNEFYHASLP